MLKVSLSKPTSSSSSPSKVAMWKLKLSSNLMKTIQTVSVVEYHVLFYKQYSVYIYSIVTMSVHAFFTTIVIIIIDLMLSLDKT